MNKTSRDRAHDPKTRAETTQADGPDPKERPAARGKLPHDGAAHAKAAHEESTLDLSTSVAGEEDPGASLDMDPAPASDAPASDAPPSDVPEKVRRPRFLRRRR